MALTDIIVLVVIGVATSGCAALLRRRRVRGRELRTSLWLCFYGTVLVAMMAAHDLEVVYRALTEPADPADAGAPYDFRLYSMLLLGALLIGAGVVCLRAVPAVSRGSAEARARAARASAFVLAIVAPLIPIQKVFGIALTVLSVASVLLLARRTRAAEALPRKEDTVRAVSVAGRDP